MNREPELSEPDAVIAVDVGGTVIKGIVEASDGTELARLDRPTDAGRGADAVVANIDAVVDELAGRLPGDVRARALGVVVLGLVDSERGVALFSANAGWRDLALADHLASRHGLPVRIDHDVRAAARAELAHGSLRRVHNGLYVAMGTGIAGATVLDGALLAGSTGMAGEIGHLTVVPDGETCACGLAGCLEAYAGAAAIARRYAVLRPEAGPADAREVIRRAQGTDHVAAYVWNAALDGLTTALTAYSMLLDPSVVVLGGGLSGAGDALVRPLERRLRERLGWHSAPRLTVGALGGDAGRAGAALLAWSAAKVPAC